MPSYWYRHDRIKDSDSPEIAKLKEFNNSIVAEKKPYFMNYIYPQQMDIYNKYIKATNKKCLREFKITMPELIAKQNKNDIEKTFLKYYYKFLPVSDNGCVMNRLCHIVEREFDGYISEIKSKSDFDYSILKSNVDYDKTTYNNIKRIYMEYQRDVKNYIVQAKTQHISHEDTSLYYQTLKKEYSYRCTIICPNPEMLCDIILDICYTNSNSKQFAWDVCGETFINNLLKANDNTITYLEADNSGNIEYNGMKFIKKQKKVEVDV